MNKKQHVRFVIVGADAAGMSAASKARRADPDLEIVAYDRGSFASYSQCEMSYLVGGRRRADSLLYLQISVSVAPAIRLAFFGEVSPECPPGRSTPRPSPPLLP